jgi:hypothetical protein
MKQFVELMSAQGSPAMQPRRFPEHNPEQFSSGNGDVDCASKLTYMGKSPK